MENLVSILKSNTDKLTSEERRTLSVILPKHVKSQIPVEWINPLRGKFHEYDYYFNQDVIGKEHEHYWTMSYQISHTYYKPSGRRKNLKEVDNISEKSKMLLDDPYATLESCETLDDVLSCLGFGSPFVCDLSCFPSSISPATKNAANTQA